MQCAGQLGRRGVRLKVAVPEGNLMVRGTRDQLRQMLEHLLNNAAQAIARFRALQEDEGPSYDPDQRWLRRACTACNGK